jgi:hypothetical protein
MGVSVSFKISGYSEEYLEKKLEKMYTLLNFKDMPFICLPENGEISKVKEIAEELREMKLGRILGYSYCPQAQAILTPAFESFAGQ